MSATPTIEKTVRELAPQVLAVLVRWIGAIVHENTPLTAMPPSTPATGSSSCPRSPC